MNNKNHHISNAIFDLSEIIGEIITEDITISELATLIENRILIETSCTGNIIRIGHPQEDNLQIIFKSETKPLVIKNVLLTETAIETESECKPIVYKQTSTESIMKIVSSCQGKRTRMGHLEKNEFTFSSSCAAKVCRYTKLIDLLGMRICDLAGVTIKDLCEKEK